MKYKICLFLTLMALPVWSAFAQQAQPNTFSLQQAIDYALTHQSAVQNAQIDEQIARNKVRETTGIGLPQVSSNFTFQDFLELPTSLIPGEFFGQAAGTFIPVQFGVKYQSSVGIEASQLLFDGSYLVGLQAAKTYKELSIRNSKRTKIETAVAVTKAYYSVLVSNEQLGLLEANLVRLRKSLHDTEAYYKNGFVEKIDVDRLMVLTNNLETEKENVVQLLDLNVKLLKFQMGMPVDAELKTSDRIADLAIKPEAAVADTNAYANRIEYALLNTKKRLNELDLKRYKSQFLPSIAAFGSMSRSYQNNDYKQLFDQSFPTSLVGLKVTFPLFTSGQRLFRVQSARLEVLKSKNDIQNLKNGIQLEISQAQTNYANGIRSLENQKRNMELSQEVLRVSRVKYEQGVGSSLEVTSAETALKEAQNNYINALYESLINRVNLDKALGRINY